MLVFPSFFPHLVHVFMIVLKQKKKIKFINFILLTKRLGNFWILFLNFKCKFWQFTNFVNVRGEGRGEIITCN